MRSCKLSLTTVWQKKEMTLFIILYNELFQRLFLARLGGNFRMRLPPRPLYPRQLPILLHRASGVGTNNGVRSDNQ